MKNRCALMAVGIGGRVRDQRHACMNGGLMTGVLMLACLSPAAPVYAASGTVQPKAVEHTVVIQNMQFTPATLILKPGDHVTWINKDLVVHTVTAQAAQFDSGDIVPEKSWTYTVQKSGVIVYRCRYHPAMQATLDAR